MGGGDFRLGVIIRRATRQSECQLIIAGTGGITEINDRVFSMDCAEIFGSDV
jgi:hypothetical protein